MNKGKTYQSGEETKQKIFAVAQELFFRKGYVDTSYGDIASEAKVNRALITYHFESKMKLAGLVYREYVREYDTLRKQLFAAYGEEEQFVISVYIYYRLMADRHVVRIVYQIVKEPSFLGMLFNSEKSFFRYVLDKRRHFTEEQCNYFIRLICGMETELAAALYTTGYGKYSEGLINTFLSIVLEYLGYSSINIFSFISHAEKILSKYEFTVEPKFHITYKIVGD